MLIKFCRIALFSAALLGLLPPNAFAHVPRRAFVGSLDGADNVLRAGRADATGQGRASFEADDFNFHVVRRWNAIDLVGRARADAQVVFDGVPPYRDGERFVLTLPLPECSVASLTNLTVSAVISGTTNDWYATESVTLRLPACPETIETSLAGVPVSDSFREYLFDARGQLRRVTDKLGAPRLQTSYDYYADGRRTRKVISAWSNDTWQVAATHQFLYDGWNLVRKIVTTGESVTTRDYTWGLDLAGQQDGQWGQDAGGIGGLLAITEVWGNSTNIFLPILDQVGTIHALVAAITNNVTLAPPALVATYDYSPYGELIECVSTLITDHRSPITPSNPCPFGFQSKYYDSETGFWYFGYRYYDARACKWLTADPLQEAGGLNLTAFCGGDPVNQVDPLGLEPNNEWQRVSVIIAALIPKPPAPTPTPPRCYITAAPPVSYQPQPVEILRDPMAHDMKCLQQANALIPTAAIGTPMGEQMYQFQSELIVGAFAEPGIALALAKLGQGLRLGRMMIGAERVSLSEARGIEAISTPLRTAPIVRSLPLETGVNLYHSTASAADGLQSLLAGIDAKYLNPGSRFGRGFYVAEGAGTAFAEVISHGSMPRYQIRYSLNAAKMSVLDLTKPEMAATWGYGGGPISSATQAIGDRARELGYNAIRFKAVQGAGHNLVVLSDFNDILIPKMVVPTP